MYIVMHHFRVYIYTRIINVESACMSGLEQSQGPPACTDTCTSSAESMTDNIFNKNERRCRDVKTQKASKQGWEANLGPKIKQTTSI